MSALDRLLGVLATPQMGGLALADLNQTGAERSRQRSSGASGVLFGIG